MPSLQHNYRNQGRGTRLLTPQLDETLIYNREQALQILDHVQKSLLSSRHRGKLLLARTAIYEALGDPKMLESALETAKEVKTAHAAALVAVAYHHHGRIKEALQWNEIAYKRPHDPGWEIDLNYLNTLLFRDDWPKAWKILLGLKKRMVHAAYLETWNGKPSVLPVSIISEGGFGDIIHTSRYIPLMNAPATIYLPPFFFDSGFVDLARRQPWMPPIKLLTETPQNIPAVGFFDFPAVFETTPKTVPGSPIWIADPERVEFFNNKLQRTDFPRVGFCREARAIETPLCPKGVYRALTTEQVDSIAAAISEHASLVDLQYGSNPDLKSWEDNAALIQNLDLVITVDTANMHLAASMGKKVWTILSGASDWKFGLSGETCVWYPTMRLFRNDAFGFDNAVQKVIAAIGDGQLGDTRK